MLTAEQLGTLKQVNISADQAKTAQRTEQLWKSQKNATKNELIEYAGCTAATMRRIYKTGAIHMKLALAFAQMLNINPYYLTGEADEPGEFTDALLLQLLEQHGYNQLAAELAPAEEAPKPKRKYTRKAKPVIEAAPAVEPMAEAEAAPEPEPEVVPEPEPEPGVVLERAAAAPAADVDIPEEDLQALLHSLVILARAGITGAQEKLAAVKGILVS
ncbi:MAG: hypothetical protein FWC27_07930 [Firmicutes bacterium]|nr:hypothetical protein [Bacillota bacterium]